MSCLKQGVHSQVDTANMAQGRRSAPALPWWAFTRDGSEAEGDGGGLLANTGLNRVRTCLKGPVTILLVLVGHSEGAWRTGREHGGWWGTGKQM